MERMTMSSLDEGAVSDSSEKSVGYYIGRVRLDDRGAAVSLKSYLALGLGVESGFFSLGVLLCELMVL